LRLSGRADGHPKVFYFPKKTEFAAPAVTSGRFRFRSKIAARSAGSRLDQGDCQDAQQALTRHHGSPKNFNETFNDFFNARVKAVSVG